MLTIKQIRDDKQAAIRKLAKKGVDAAPVIARIETLDDRRKAIQTELDNTLAAQNKAAKEIGALMGQGRRDEAEERKRFVADLKEKSNRLQAESHNVQEELQAAIVSLPNFPADIVPEGKTAEDIKARSIHLLEMAGIANSEGVYKMFPHELSGGMRQRVMIAMALSCNPRLIIADEPTTALDVTIQAQILDLLRNLKDKINSSIMLITHDLGVIAEMADYVVVMYAGRVVEKGTAQEIFANPAHPYTIGLMASKPMVGKKVDKLYSIPGKVPNPINMPNYCYFKDRCEMCVDGCQGEYPHMIQLSPTHMVSCYRYYGKEDAQNG